MDWPRSRRIVAIALLGFLVGVEGSRAEEAKSSPDAVPAEGEIGTRATPMLKQGMQPLASPGAAQALQTMPIAPPSSPCWRNIEPPYQGQYVPPTHYHTVSAAAFSLASQPAPGVHYQFRFGTSVRTWRDSNAIANRISFAAPLFLPQGVVIRQVEVFLKDDDPQYNLIFSLGETIALTGTDLGPAGAMLSLSSDCVKSTDSAIIRLNGFAVPINSQRAYWMSVEWDVNNLNNPTFDSGIHLHFVRLGYTLP